MPVRFWLNQEAAWRPPQGRTEANRTGKFTFQTFGAGFPHGNIPCFEPRFQRPSAPAPVRQYSRITASAIRKRSCGPFDHLICRNIQGSLLMSRAVLIRSSDIHQHNRARHAAFRRHHHGGGNRGAFRIPAFQPDEEGCQPGHHDHIQNHVFHAATSLNRGEVIKRKYRQPPHAGVICPPARSGGPVPRENNAPSAKAGRESSFPSPPYSERPEKCPPTPHHQSPQPGRRIQKRGFPIPLHPRVLNIPEASSPSPRLPEFRWKPHLRAIGS